MTSYKLHEVMKRQLPAFGSMTETCAVRRQSVDWLDQPQHWNTCTTHNNTTMPQAHAATCVTPTPRATCASSTRRYMRHTHTSSNMCLKHTPLHAPHPHLEQHVPQAHAICVTPTPRATCASSTRYMCHNMSMYHRPAQQNNTFYAVCSYTGLLMISPVAD